MDSMGRLSTFVDRSLSSKNHTTSRTRTVPAGGRAAQEIPFPYGLPRPFRSGGGRQGGGCAPRTEFIRLDWQSKKDLSVNQDQRSEI